MKTKTAFCVLFLLLPSIISSMQLDTSLFRYFPLKVGNRWTWYREANHPPGNGFETMKILSTQVMNDHLYFMGQYDQYYNGVLINSSSSYYRIDSLSGNLYQKNGANECLIDSLNSARSDSAYNTCLNRWNKCDTSSYFLFNQNIRSKKFNWIENFELSGYRQYSKNFGKVNERTNSVTNYTILNLRGCLIDGVLTGDTSILVGITLVTAAVPEHFSLSQNYPNPFNPTTNIEFSIPSVGATRRVALTVHNLLGEEIETLFNGELKPGTYKADWSATGGAKNFPSGVYFYKLTSGSFTETRKMVLLK